MPKHRIVERDGCMKQVYHYEGETVQHVQVKRRPTAYADRPRMCSWVEPCADHPSANLRNRRLHEAGKEWRLR